MKKAKKLPLQPIGRPTVYICWLHVHYAHASGHHCEK